MEFFEILMDTHQTLHAEWKYGGTPFPLKGRPSWLAELVSVMTSPYVSRNVITCVRALELPRNLLNRVSGLRSANFCDG